MHQDDQFQARLPARITGIVFWALVVVGLGISVILLEGKESELYSQNRLNSRILAYELEGILEAQSLQSRTDVLISKIKLKVNQLRDDMGFTAVVLSKDDMNITLGDKGADDNVFPYSLHYYQDGSTIPKSISLSVFYPNLKQQVRNIRKDVLLTIGLSVFVFGLVLQQILHRVLSGPFNRMVGAAMLFSHGNDSVRFDDSRKDEFGYLGGFINNAIESILSSQDKLKHALNRAEHSEKELSRQKEQAEVTLKSITDSVITVDLTGAVLYINPAAELLFRTSNKAVYKQHLSRLVRLVSDASGEAIEDPLKTCFDNQQTVLLPEHTSLIAGENKVIAVEATVAPMKNNEGSLIGAVMVIQDVSHTRKLARQLSYQASHDMLTGLYNRLKFEEYLKEALLNIQQEPRHHSLCYLDLDQFKVVNDTCGHVAGDELLRQVPELFHKVLRSGDVVARLGGDEFGILLENCEIDKATVIANKIREAIKDFRFVWEDKVFTIGVSIGLVSIDETTLDIAEVMSAADVACYAAKDSGRNRVHVYEHSDELVAERHGEMHWTARITHAMEENRFVLYKQPIIGITGSTSTHFEVLVRMIDENGDIVPPGAFIPAAERYNLMSGIDRWVINEVFQMIADGGHPGSGFSIDDVISINLSGDSLSDEDLFDYIVLLKDSLDISMENICFEITETIAISNLVRATTLINELKQLGCRFSLDDFGSGLSSFAYLKNLPVNYLKIDGSFVRDVSRDPIDRAMVVSIQQMAEAMRLHTIAEWVEDEETLNTLKEIGVNYVQGYYLGKPKPVKQHYLKAAAAN